MVSRSPDVIHSVPRSHYESDELDSEETGVIAIGMAVSSPVIHQDSFAPSSAWQPGTVTTITASKQDKSEALVEQASNGLTRTKSRKWGLFSRSKSKRGKDSERPLQVSSPTNLSRTAASANELGHIRPKDELDLVSGPKGKSLGRSLTDAKRHYPEFSFQKSSPGLDAKTRTTSPEPATVPAQAQDRLREPLLNVDIPDISLERYSVMFAGLLEHRSTSSLLARRQDTQDRLRALRQEQSSQVTPRDPQTVRRTDSINRDLPPLPPLRLETSQVKEAHVSNNRGRSNTSPAVFVPSKEKSLTSEKVNIGTPNSPHVMRFASVKAKKGSYMPDETSKHQGPQLQLRSKFHTQSSRQGLSPSRMVFGSAEGSEKESEHTSPAPRSANAYKTKISYHTEASASPSTSTSGSNGLQPVITARYKATPDVQASLSSSLSSLSGDEPDEVGSGSAVQDAVQVSIARQISISRKQRNMLGPLQMNPIECQRAADTKLSTPRLITPQDNPSSPLAAYRKSERTVLDST